MRCLTVCQPWAWAIVHGEKAVENRVWSTAYRGTLLIHAGLGRDFETADAMRTLAPSNPPDPAAMTRGALVGVCELIAVARPEQVLGQWRHQAPYALGPWCWALYRRRWFPRPVPCTGQRGLWLLPTSLEQPIAEQIRAARPAGEREGQAKAGPIDRVGGVGRQRGLFT